MRNLYRLLLLAVAIVVGAVTFRAMSPLPVITVEELIAEAREGRVAQVVFGEERESVVAVSDSRGKFLVRLRQADSPDLARRLSALGVRVLYERKSLGLI